ncbi:aminoacyl-tRNA hydrolase [bacterium]|nr:aminoacyl-tRNA hydrolase [bacterium]
MAIKAILGLGNPGKRYCDTRHNVGFKIIDLFLSKSGAHWQKGSIDYHFSVVKHRNRKIVLCKPMTYMNNSGIAFMEICEKHNLNPEEILVVVDDFNLDFGQLRLKKQGSDGGHNGLASIIFHSETINFPRLRIGIGAPSEDTVDYVLSGFSEAEEKEISNILSKSVDAIKCVLRDGIEKAMEIYNRKMDSISPEKHDSQDEQNIN